MPVFAYTARDRSGQVSTGTLEAENDSGAAARLREQGLWVTELKITVAPVQRRRETAPTEQATETEQASYSLPRGAHTDDSIARRMRSPVPLKDLALFYRQLHTMLNSGMGLFQSLELMTGGAQCPNPALRNVIGELARQVLAGGRLSEAMARFPWLFDRMQLRMVEAGESGGLLVEIFHRLADYLEREYHVRQEVKRKTLYPKLVLGLLVLVLPINMPLTLPGYLASLGRILLWIFGAGIPLWLVMRFFLTSRAGRDFWDQVKLAIPVIGPVVRKLAAARFARTLAALYGAGVPIASAMGMAGEACGNYSLEQASRRAVPAIEKGVSIATTLQATGFFPGMFLGMVSTGETSGNLDTMMDKAADFYEEEALHATNQLVITLGVVALIIVAILVAIKLISFYTGMIGGIMNNAGGAGGE